MIQELLPMLGNTPGNLTLFTEIAAALSLIGLGLWLAGARFSRQIIALSGVAAGALAGKFLPDFYPVNLSPPVLAIVGALVFGLIAFVTHRLWIGVALGSVLAWWASLGTWIVMHGQQSWSQPVWDADMTISRFGTQLWSVLPADVTRILPWAAGSAMLTGVAMAIVWPRVATVLNWSLAGMSLVLCAGLALLTYQRPQWIGMLPAQNWSQMTAFGGLVLFGALVQWKLAPRGAVKKAAKPAPPTE
jgi:hypothetical protein